MRLSNKQRLVNLTFTLTLVLITAWAVYSEVVTSRPWKKYQREFRRIVIDDGEKKLQALKRARQGAEDSEKLQKTDRSIELLQLGLAKAKASGPKIIQNWLLEFNNEADRCVTCHQGVEKQGFEKQPHPYRTHSGNYIEKHPVQTFGCINCHDGEGHALTVEQAHGQGENWVKPLLKGSYAQAKCVKCHFLDQKLPLDIKLPGGEKVVKGWKIYMESNCLGCHVNSLYKRPERIAPVLMNVGKKVNLNWLKKWLKNPKDYLPKTKMPNFLLKDDEVDLIASYTLSLSKGERVPGPEAGLNLDSKSAIDSGEKLVNQLGCTGCHTIDGKGGDFGPDLSDIGSKTSPEWLFYWLNNPRDYQPKTPMPNLRIPENELQDIVAYLNTLKKDKDPSGASTYLPGPEDIQRGRELVKEKGCTGCHEIESFPPGFNAPPHDGVASKRPEELVWTNLQDSKDKSLTNWLTIKVTEPRKFASEKIITKMPKFNFNEEEAEALVAFILSFTKESFPKEKLKILAKADSVEMKGRKLLEEKNCLACHKINYKGGDIGPDLTAEGKKVRPEWMFSFLTSPYRLRPMQEARMPYFKLKGEEITAVIEYLAFVAGEKYPYIYEDKKEVYVEDIEKGKKLYHQELACMGCHTFEGKGGLIGPEHTDLASRLRRDYLERWLKDPQSIIPDVRMPRFIFREQELEYLTDYLMTMGRERFLAVQ